MTGKERRALRRRIERLFITVEVEQARALAVWESIDKHKGDR